MIHTIRLHNSDGGVLARDKLFIWRKYLESSSLQIFRRASHSPLYLYPSVGDVMVSLT